MNNENEQGQLLAPQGQIIREKHISVPELLEKLDTMTESKAARDAASVIRRFQRLLLPIYMSLAQEALGGNEIKDEQTIFTFMGPGASDFTHVAEFRSLMGDERASVLEYEQGGFTKEPRLTSDETPVQLTPGEEIVGIPLNTQEEVEEALRIWMTGVSLAVDANAPMYAQFESRRREISKKFEQ